MSAFLQSLADVLNVAPAEARAALEAFAGRLRARVQEEGTVEYGGLGTFRDAGGRLAFEPDESVALVVNHRYAGMEPISLTTGAPPTWQPGLSDDEHPLGAHPTEEVFEDATPEEEAVEPATPPVDFGEPEVEEEAVWTDVPPPGDGPDLPPLFASDETLMALRDASRERGASPSEEAEAWAGRIIEEETPPEPAEEPEPEPDLPPPPLHDASVPVEGRMEVLHDYDESTPDEEEAGEALLVTPPEETAALPPPVAIPPPADAPLRARAARDPEPERRFPWIPALVLLVLVGAVLAVLLLRNPDPAPPPVIPPATDTSAVAVMDTAAVAPGDTTAVAAAETPPAETPAAAPDDALRGTAPVTAGRGYTIVIGGGTQAQASNLAASFQQQGYRTGVLSGRTDNGGTIYRAAIGQFSTLGEAQAALRRVEGLPAGSWILNLSSSLVRAE